MNGLQSRKAHDMDKPFPGCLGRMVNIFELSTGTSGKKLLTDRPHRDGSSLSRSRSDVARVSNPPFGDQIEDKLTVSELRRISSNGKANGMPMKMLLDQEMSTEMESCHSSPNVIAKLMGLDTLPLQQPGSDVPRSHRRGYSQCTVKDPGMPLGYWEQDGFMENGMQCQFHQCTDGKEYKDVYEIWQQSPQKNCVEKSPHKGKPNENMNEKKMALVRQKFMEAKRLAIDEKLRQSKEFQDALEVLSSNKDLVVKFLQEPNSLFPQHYEFPSIPTSPETKRITVLRPSKNFDKENVAGKKSDILTKKPAQLAESAVWEKTDLRYSPTLIKQSVDEYAVQPTRIVLLKPSPVKTHDIKPAVSPPCLLPGIVHGERFDEEPEEDDEAQESRKVAREITRQMRENLMGHRRDETLLSSVFSNGYTGDESSFNKSENEYAEENLSDSEVMSPSSRHSWDYVNRFSSPFSSSSFSRASCSLESSVCREAKKRLSERWAMMASHGISQEQRRVKRSSSTLGEMLALSDTKKPTGSEEEVKEQEPRESVPCLTSGLDKGCMGDSPRSLLRSKSVPLSSSVFVNTLNEASVPKAGKIDVSKELTKTKSTKSSLKWKVSNLLFSRNRKSTAEKCEGTRTKDESQSPIAGSPGPSVYYPGRTSVDAAHMNNGGLEERLSPALRGSSSTSSGLTNMGVKEGMVFPETDLCVTRPIIPGNTSENQEQPSPISVLAPPFDEDENTIQESSAYKKPGKGFQAPLKSNLIDKSPPIESIARTISWDDSYADTTSPYRFKPSAVSIGTKEEEQNWLVFVRTLLTASGLEGELQYDSIFTRWHSLENPLDRSLRDKYANLSGREPLHEANRRQLRSSWKLIFDCVNAVLLEIMAYRSDMSTRVMLCSGAHEKSVESSASPMLVDCVWARMKEWFSSEFGCVPGDDGYSDSLVLERVIKKEVVGEGWVEHLRMEMDDFGKEIERKLLEELVEEAVVDFTGRFLL